MGPSSERAPAQVPSHPSSLRHVTHALILRKLDTASSEQRHQHPSPPLGTRHWLVSLEGNTCLREPCSLTSIPAGCTTRPRDQWALRPSAVVHSLITLKDTL